MEALKKPFSGLSEENLSNEDHGGTLIASGSILHNTCQVLDLWKWIVPDGATSTIDVIETMIDKNLISLRNIFCCFCFATC